jgi:signal transduction histidine kinase/ActR/RegA family two-component response regulator
VPPTKAMKMNGSWSIHVSAHVLIACGAACLTMILFCGVILVLLIIKVLGGATALCLYALASLLCAASSALILYRMRRHIILHDSLPLDDLRAAFGGAEPHSSEPFQVESEALSACLNTLESHKSAAGSDGYPGRPGNAFSDSPATSRFLFDVFMAHLPAMAVVKDQQGHYLYASRGCHKLLQKAPEEIIGRTDAEIWPAHAGKMAMADRDVLAEGNVTTTIEKMPVGNEQRHHAITRFAITPPGSAAFLGSITFDVTERLQAEEDKIQLEQQLLQAQKMEAIGTLASGIAHDFNNILGAIFGYVELARLDSPHNENVQAQLDQVLKAAHRARDLVRQILTFSRKHDQDRKPLDLEPLVNEALKLLRASLPATIAIRSELNNDGALVSADATQMHQVIMNLCTNASHAMDNNVGELSVGLKKIHVAQSGAGRRLVAGDYLELSVQDTGQGINAALKERIFEPYFTTKAPGKGTGMGLAVVHGIVKSHGGTIEVESLPGEGSRFSVLLPVTESVVRLPRVKIGTLPRGNESLLFLDDEIFLADLGRQMLSRLGYGVVCSTSPIEALQIIRTAPSRFDLLITDLTMPHMTGEVLIQQVAALRPDLPVILCTGYSQRLEKERAARLGINALLMKPLTIGDLARTVREVLDRTCAPVSAAGGS